MPSTGRFAPVQQMVACLRYTAVLGAEIYETIGELKDELREDQKKRAFDGWDHMDTKRQLEDSLCDAQGEIADLKAWVNTLEFLVEKLTRPVPEVPKEAVFRVASPSLPDIGFPPEEIPGLTVNQTTVDEFLDWSSFNRSWPHGGYEADVEKDGEGDSNKENEWVAVPVDECHNFHLFTYFFLSSKRPNTRSNHDMALSYLILSYLFSSHFKVTRRRTGKADSIGIPIRNYLLVDWNSNPLVLLVGVPIPILLHISLIPTMRPTPIEGRPIKELVDGGLVNGQTRDLLRRETNVGKRRRSNPECHFLGNRRSRTSQLLNQELQSVNPSLEVDNLPLSVTKGVFQLPLCIHTVPTVKSPLLLVLPQLVLKLPDRLIDLGTKDSGVTETGVHPPVHLIPNMMDLSETPPDPSLGEALYIETLDVLSPPLLPNHHQVPKTKFPKLVVPILRSLHPRTDVGARGIRTGQIVPTGLLSTLVVPVDKQLFVPSGTLLIQRMMVIAFATKGLRGDKFGLVETEQSGNTT